MMDSLSFEQLTNASPKTPRRIESSSPRRISSPHNNNITLISSSTADTILETNPSSNRRDALRKGTRIPLFLFSSLSNYTNLKRRHSTTYSDNLSLDLSMDQTCPRIDSSSTIVGRHSSMPSSPLLNHSLLDFDTIFSLPPLNLDDEQQATPNIVIEQPPTIASENSQSSTSSPCTHKTNTHPTPPSNRVLCKSFSTSCLDLKREPNSNFDASILVPSPKKRPTMVKVEILSPKSKTRLKPLLEPCKSTPSFHTKTNHFFQTSAKFLKRNSSMDNLHPLN